MPTTFVLRLTSLFSRSNGFVLQILAQCAVGKDAKAVRSSWASSSILATAGNFGCSMAATLPTCSVTSAPVGWAKIVRIAAATISAEPLGTLARTFLRKWTRQRCQQAPAMTAAMAPLRPVWASQTTSWTLCSPRAVSERPGRDDNRPRHHPPIDPGLEVGGVDEQVREGCVSQRPRAEGGHVTIQLGADPGDLRLGDPRLHTQGLDQVVDLAGGSAVHVGLHDHRQQGPVDTAAGLQQRREEGALAQLGDLELDITGLGRQQPRSGAVAVRSALLGPFIGPSPDVLGGLDLDQRLEHQSQPFADDVQVTAGAQCIQQLGQGRLAKGHRGELLGVNPGRNTLSFTRWPSPCYSAEQGLPQSPPLPGTPTPIP